MDLRLGVLRVQQWHAARCLAGEHPVTPLSGGNSSRRIFWEQMRPRGTGYEPLG